MFPSFSKRSIQPELMDDPQIGFDDFRDCLSDLALVNICTFAYRPALHWLRRIVDQYTSLRFRSIVPERPISIIDIGCGGGDTLRKIAQWAVQHRQAFDLIGVDHNPWSKQYADQATPSWLNIKFETTDIFEFEPARQADFVISSLFTHHLNDEQLVRFLQWMERHAKHGWLINDLHRHPLAYFLIKYTSRLLRFHYMVQHDGPISVARAFTKADWVKYLIAADVPLDQVKIRWFFPFRYSVVRLKL